MRGTKSTFIAMVTVVSIISLYFVVIENDFLLTMEEADEDISRTSIKEQRHHVVDGAVNIQHKDNSNEKVGKESSSATPTNPAPVISIEPHLEQLPTNLTWVPVSPTERQRHSRCTGPFQHCCIGQCRQAKFAIQPGTKAYNDLIVKPTAPNMNITDMHGLLTVLNRTVQHLNLPWCTLWFVGDSMSSDHAMAAICQLMQLGYEISRCNSAFGGPLYGEQDTSYCETTFPNSTLPTKTTAEMISNDTDMPCRRIRVRYSPTNENGDIIKLPGYRFYADDEAGAIVLNHGVHCNDRKCMVDWMRDVFTPFYVNDYLGAPNATQERYFPIWREHEPQHFDTPGGGYILHANRKKKCGANITMFNNYRNEIAEQYLKEHESLLGKIPIVRLFEQLKPMHRFHYDKPGDCTHYCYSPWRFNLSWHGIAQGLEAIWEKRYSRKN